MDKDGLTDEELAAIQRIEARLEDMIMDGTGETASILLIEEELQMLRELVRRVEVER